MEFAFELLFQIIVEGTVDIGLDAVTSKKVPLFFRIIALIVFLAIYVGIISLLVIYGMDALRSHDRFGGVLCIGTALIVLVGCIYAVVRKMRKRHEV